MGARDRLAAGAQSWVSAVMAGPGSIEERVARFPGCRIALEASRHGDADGDADADADDALAAIELAMSAAAGMDLPGATPVEIVIVPEWAGGESGVRRLAEIARATGTMLTLAPGPATDVDAMLTLAAQLDAGVTIPASLRRAERDGSTASGRVRVVKGPDVRGDRFAHELETDKSLVRCVRVLTARAAAGEPLEISVGTQDGRLADIVLAIAARARLAPLELALHDPGAPVPLPVTALRTRLLTAGVPVRAFVPFGPASLERLASGILERPAGIAGALRSVLRS